MLKRYKGSNSCVFMFGFRNESFLTFGLNSFLVSIQEQSQYIIDETRLNHFNSTCIVHNLL